MDKREDKSKSAVMKFMENGYIDSVKYRREARPMSSPQMKKAASKRILEAKKKAAKKALPAD